MRSTLRVRSQRRADRGLHPFMIERLEERVALSASAPTLISIGPAPITDPYEQNLNFNGKDYVSPAAISGAVQTIALYNSGGGATGAYIGAALGGIWQTPDLFAANPVWTTNTDSMPSLAISSLAVSPLDSTGQTVFAGTGGTSNGGAIFTANLAALETGLYLTTNGGQTWSALNDSSSPVYGTFITKVLPTSSGTSLADQTVLVGTKKGLFVSANGGSTFQTQTFTNPVLDLIADPNTSGRYYLLAGPDSKGDGTGVYISNDTGGSWTSINGGDLTSDVLKLIPTAGPDGGAGRLAATTQSGQTLLYMTFERNDDPGGDTYLNTYGIFQTSITSSGTANWQLGFKFDNKAEGGDADNLALAVDPGNPGIVYTAGYGDNVAYRIVPDVSSPSSASKTELTNEDIGSLYDLRSIAFATNSTGNEVLVITSDSGVYGLTSPTTAGEHPTWDSFLGNISVSEVYSIDGMAGSSGQLYVGGGAQDTGSFQTTISSSGQVGAWVSNNGGDGGGAAYDPAVGMAYATDDYLAGSQIANASTNEIQTNVTFAGLDSLDNNENDSPSSILFVVTAANTGAAGTPSPVVASGYGLYEAQPTSLSSGSTIDFIQINPADSSNASDADSYPAIVFGGMLSGTPDPYILYASRTDSTLWTSDSFGAAATQVTGWSSSNGTIIGLALDPTNDQHIYALTTKALFVSSDGGQEWTNYATQPPSGLGDFRSLAVVPTTVSGNAVNLLVVGAAFGADVLPDNPALGVTTWSPISTNLPNVAVFDLAYVSAANDLLIGTFGRGDWLLTNASTALLYTLADSTTTSLEAPSAATWGEPITLTAQASPQVAGGAALTGNVVFTAMSGSIDTPLGTVTLGTDGKAVLDLPEGLPVGTLILSASYSGDANYLSSAGQANTTVSPASTTTGLSAPGSVAGNRSFKVTAHVVPKSGNVAATGSVTFFDGTIELGTSSLNLAGAATLNVGPLSLGNHSLSASYTPKSGSPFSASDTSSPSNVKVVAVATHTVVAAPSSARTGSAVAISATITASGGVPTGSVTFFEDGHRLGASSVNASGRATWTVKSFAVGSHTLYAAFQPSPGSPYAPSPNSQSVTIHVAPVPIPPKFATTTTLAATPLGPAVLNRRSQALFSVQVQAGSSGPVSGTVELMVRQHVIASGSLDATGAANFTLRVLGLFRRPITAIYLGGSVPRGPALPSQSSPFVPTRVWFLRPRTAGL